MDKKSLSDTFASFEAQSNLTASDLLMTRLRTSIAASCRTVLEWERRRRSRKVLRSLKSGEIRDFCLDLMGAEREASKPFWRA